MGGQDVQLAIRVRLKQKAWCDEYTVYLMIQYISGEHPKDEYGMCEYTQREIYEVVCTYITIEDYQIKLICLGHCITYCSISFISTVAGDNKMLLVQGQVLFPHPMA
jgi:hypothetical protein